MRLSGKGQLIARYYELGVWDKARVRNAVKRCWISEEEYELIVGEEYDGGGKD